MKKIEREDGNPDAWICQCGNRPEEDGFYPCDEAGNLVEPTPEEWGSGLYVCFRCGAMIDPETLAIVGQADPAVVQSQF